MTMFGRVVRISVSASCVTCESSEPSKVLPSVFSFAVEYIIFFIPPGYSGDIWWMNGYWLWISVDPISHTTPYTIKWICAPAKETTRQVLEQWSVHTRPTQRHAVWITSAYMGCETYRDWSSSLTCHALDYIIERTSLGIRALTFDCFFFFFTRENGMDTDEYLYFMLAFGCDWLVGQTEFEYSAEKRYDFVRLKWWQIKWRIYFQWNPPFCFPCLPSPVDCSSANGWEISAVSLRAEFRDLDGRVCSSKIGQNM